MLRFLNLLSTLLLNIRFWCWMFCDAAICSPARWLSFFCGCQATKATYAIMVSSQCLIKNSISCTREYANLHLLLNIIQYHYWDKSDKHFYLPKQLSGVNTQEWCDSTWHGLFSLVVFLRHGKSHSGSGLTTTCFASAIFSLFPSFTYTLRYGFAWRINKSHFTDRTKGHSNETKVN